MAERTQNFDNHTRWNPLYHFVASPILLLNVIVALRAVMREATMETGWQLVVAIGIYAGLLAARMQPLILQNRVIRLEEQLRLQRLLPATPMGEIEAIRTRDLIALRFASDAELPELVRRVRAGEFKHPKEIKRAVKHWRADFMRV
jgi:hypothetical protein